MTDGTNKTKKYRKFKRCCFRLIIREMYTGNAALSVSLSNLAERNIFIHKFLIKNIVLYTAFNKIGKSKTYPFLWTTNRRWETRWLVKQCRFCDPITMAFYMGEEKKNINETSNSIGFGCVIEHFLCFFFYL